MLGHLKRFFRWVAGQPGYKARISYSHAEYFNLSDKESRIATARRERPFPTIEQVRHVVTTMPAGSDVERRNRALIAFTLLTGARDSAIASMKLKHVDLIEGKVYQDAREVNTKFSKSITTFFFPVGDDIVQIVVDWVNFLRQQRLWGNDDPLFPPTAVMVGKTQRFQAAGFRKEHWSNASAIRGIFKAAFTTAGLSYFQPHSLRNTLVQLGETLCCTAEDFKAWSQNLGHEGVLTTFRSYGAVGTRRQGEIIRGLGQQDKSVPTIQLTEEAILSVLRRLKDEADSVRTGPV
jgi:integrase/recombinase XerD